MDTITAIRQFLKEHCSQVQITLISTRVLLETGVNLTNIAPERDSDPSTVTEINAILREMGVLP